MKPPSLSATSRWNSRRFQTAVGLLLSALVWAGLLAVPLGTHAQSVRFPDLPSIDQVPAETAQPEPSPVIQSPPPVSIPVTDQAALEGEYLELARVYRGQLAEYQQAEKNYRQALLQYQQLQTLAALDQAVLETQRLMLARNQVLVTYAQQLRLYLVNTQGIEVTVKTDTLTRIEQLLNFLNQHQVQVEAVSDRFELAAVAADFEIVEPEYETVSAYSLALIQFGRLQTAHDQTTEVLDLVQDLDVSSLSELRQGQWQRSLSETVRFNQQVQAQFTQTFLELQEFQQAAEISDITRFRADLELLYGQVGQTQTYLKELAQMLPPSVSDLDQSVDEDTL